MTVFRLPLLICLFVALLSAPATAAPADGYVRLAHLSPDTPAVDVYLYSPGTTEPRLVLRHVEYGVLSPYQRLPGGKYTVAMRPANAAASSKPVLSTKVRVRAGEAYTVAGMGPYKGIQLRVLDDSPSLGAGRAAVRVVEASLRHPVVKVSSPGRTIAAGLRFPAVTAYQPMRAGTAAIRVAGDSGAPSTVKVRMAAGSAHTVIVLDGGSGLRLIDLRDTSHGGRTPHGGVDTGLGGMSRAPASTSSTLDVGGLLVLLGVGVAGIRRRA